MTGSWQGCRTGHISLRLLSGVEGGVGAGARLSGGLGVACSLRSPPGDSATCVYSTAWLQEQRQQSGAHAAPASRVALLVPCVGPIHPPSGHLTRLWSHLANLPHPVMWDKDD